MNTIQRTVFKMLQPVFGKQVLQKMFENLMVFSHFGQNYGLGGDFNVSGEKFVLDYINKQFKLNRKDEYILFDVGANVGEYTLELAKQFSQIPHLIYSFEPNPQTFTTLKSNLE